MFQGLKGIIVVGLLSLLTTLNIAFTQSFSDAINQTVAETVGELSEEFASGKLPQPDLESLVAALRDGFPKQLSSETGGAVLAQRDQPTSRSMYFLLFCEIAIRDFTGCGELDLEARGFDVSDPANFIENNRGKIDEEIGSGGGSSSP